MENKNEPFWDDSSLPMALGCQGCSRKDICGGIRNQSGAWDCNYYCECSDVDNCPIVCHRKPKQLVECLREIQGYQFDNIPKLPQVKAQSTPSVVPLLFSKSGRTMHLDAKAVCIPLRSLFSKKTGLPLISSREELSQRFRFKGNAKFLISGVDHDQHIENYWSLGRNMKFFESLKTLGPSLVTTPNYSCFGDVPRWNDMTNMKRIAICWAEFTSAGIPAALHLNGRTATDYSRWTEFIARRNEVFSICFEFGTGAASPRRAHWHADHLIKLAEQVGRPLTLVIKGGEYVYTKLLPHFEQVVLLSSEPFMKSVKRKRLEVSKDGTRKWIKIESKYIDDLLQSNVDHFVEHFQQNKLFESAA